MTASMAGCFVFEYQLLSIEGVNVSHIVDKYGSVMSFDDIKMLYEYVRNQRYRMYVYIHFVFLILVCRTMPFCGLLH